MERSPEEGCHHTKNTRRLYAFAPHLAHFQASA